MRSSARVIGILLLILGLAVALILGSWVISGFGELQLSRGGGILGLGIVALIALPLIGAGVYLLLRSQQESAALNLIRQERRILEIVAARGKVRIPDLVLELGSNRDQVKVWIYDLVGKGLFSGYINWNDETLYSRQASEMPRDRCPNCGGQLELAGKGVIECPFCGSDIFLKEERPPRV